MEKHKRFRNHISIILERMGGVFIFVGLAVISGLMQSGEDLLEGLSLLSGSGAALPVLLAVLGILFLILLWQYVVWAKTYISIPGNTIVIERETMNRKKNTIGIRNISNVNTEQNLFEMLIGTCKVKLDTNSLSTADRTDVKIVLRKPDAIRFKEEILSLMQDSAEEQSRVMADTEAAYTVRAGLGDMMVHGFFSINLVSVLILLGCVAGAAEVLSGALGQGLAGRSLMSIAASMLVGAVFFFSALWDIMRGFFRYHNFKAGRDRDRLYISYGLTKKVNYMIPVDKINAVKLNQSLLARLAGRYMAEIINVGMGDDESEKQSFLVLYCRKSKMETYIRELLPEFSGLLDTPVKRQPSSVWFVWILPVLAYLACAAGALAASLLLLPDTWKVPAVLTAAGVTLLVFVFMVCRFFTAGSKIEKNFLKLANGYMGRRFVCIPYAKIQYVQLEQNFLGVCAGIQKGTVKMLAAAANVSQGIPYFSSEGAELLKEKIVAAGRHEVSSGADEDKQ